MTHHTIDYSTSPAKQFDAVADVQFYLGESYADIARSMSKFTDPVTFCHACSFLGISGYPVEAWFDHFWGSGEFQRKLSGTRRDS